jgi:HK97 family phage portal protein
LRELHILRPDRIQIVPGEDGWPEAYEYSVDGTSPIRLDGEAIPGVRRVLHQKLFHPLNDHYGLSPIEAAASAIDIHNAASRWNKALLDNSARPSGALVYTSRDGNLTTEQYERLKSELETGFQGAGNAGRPLLLEGGLDWKSMSMSPKDLDFMEAKHGAAREIALALGVPPMLLGIPGDNTFSNYQEANRNFWRQTVLPIVQRIVTALNEWLTPGYSGALTLKPNIDDLDALSSERDAQWARLEKTSFLTDDEKRSSVGYGPLPPQQKFNPGQARKPSGKPGGGQWTKPGGGGGGGGRNDGGAGNGSGEGGGEGDTDTGDGPPTDPFGDGLGNIDPEAFNIPELPSGGTDEIVDKPESDVKDPEAEVEPANTRRRAPSGASPAQEARWQAADAQARDAVRRVRELDPEWRGPTSITGGVEGEIAHRQAVANAANQRYREILQDAVPGTNPSWGVNRLQKELYERGYYYEQPTRAPGNLYRNPVTEEEVRIMEQPRREWRNDPPEKHHFQYYYRYRSAPGKPEGRHVPIPDKD